MNLNKFTKQKKIYYIILVVLIICQYSLFSYYQYLIKDIQSHIITLFFFAMNPYGTNQAQNPSPYQPISENSSDFADSANPLLDKKRSKHIQALIATLWLIIGQIGFIVLYFIEGWKDSMGIGGLIGVIAGIYVSYLVIALCCNSLADYLRNMQTGDKLESEYEQIRIMQGRFIFTAVCYHYQTRYHVRTVRDNDGKTRTQTYTTQERVVTHSATQTLDPARTEDESGGIDQVRALTNIIFVHFIVDYRFGDSYSQNYFNNFWNGFKARHTRDAHQDFKFNYQMPPFKARQSFFVGQKGCSFNCWLYIMTLFGLIWPYSLWIQTKITRYNTKFMKKLSF